MEKIGKNVFSVTTTEDEILDAIGELGRQGKKIRQIIMAFTDNRIERACKRNCEYAWPCRDCLSGNDKIHLGKSLIITD